MVKESTKPQQYNKLTITFGECETASNAYLMSLAIIMIGLPLPIINLLASVGFWYANRKKTSEFVRWHSTQALLGQLPLFATNTILLWWTIAILLDKATLSSIYCAYAVTVGVFNIVEFIAFIRAAINVNKQIDHRWFILAPLTDYFIKKTPTLPKFYKESVIFFTIFFIAICSLSQINWNSLLEPALQKGEAALSNEIKKLFVSDQRTINNHHIIKPIDSLFQELCKANRLNETEYQLHIIHEYDRNAFSLPGKHIVVYSGLITSCKNSTELMSVLAHELAHAEQKHSKYKILHAIAIGGASILLGQTNATKHLNNIIGTVVQNTYSQSLENEADSIAVKYMLNAKWNPLRLGTILQRIDTSSEKEENPTYEKWLRTHPYSQERVKNIARQVKALCPDTTQLHDPLSIDKWENLIFSVRNL